MVNLRSLSRLALALGALASACRHPDALRPSSHGLVAGASPACAAFAPDTRVWTPVGECPEGDFVELTQVEPGPEGWTAILSEGEATRPDAARCHALPEAP